MPDVSPSAPHSPSRPAAGPQGVDTRGHNVGRHAGNPQGRTQAVDAFGAAVKPPHDEHYEQWREEQMRQCDADYAQWRQERYQRFCADFEAWRRERQGRQHLSQGPDQPRDAHSPDLSIGP